MAPIGRSLSRLTPRPGPSAAWESAASVWTGSFDKTLKCWDVAEGGGDARATFDAPKAIASVAVWPGGRVAWCGGGDKAVHAWDPRVGQTTGAMTTWTSHEVRRNAREKRSFFFSPTTRTLLSSFFPERKKRPEGMREPPGARAAPRSPRPRLARGRKEETSVTNDIRFPTPPARGAVGETNL